MSVTDKRKTNEKDKRIGIVIQTLLLQGVVMRQGGVLFDLDFYSKDGLKLRWGKGLVRGQRKFVLI